MTAFSYVLCYRTNIRFVSFTHKLRTNVKKAEVFFDHWKIDGTHRVELSFKRNHRKYIFHFFLFLVLFKLFDPTQAFQYLSLGYNIDRHYHFRFQHILQPCKNCYRWRLLITWKEKHSSILKVFWKNYRR